MYYGGGLNGTNEQSKPLTHDFVSLMLKGRTDGFALKGRGKRLFPLESEAITSMRTAIGNLNKHFR